MVPSGTYRVREKRPVHHEEEPSKRPKAVYVDDVETITERLNTVQLGNAEFHLTLDDAVKRGMTDLMIASMNGYEQIVKSLLMIASMNKDEQRVAHDTRDDYGWTALMFASHFGKNACVNYLLDWGAVVDASDINGETALMKASEHGKLECCRTLIRRNAALDAQCHDGSTALMLAAYHNKPLCVEALIDGGAIMNIKDGAGDTALELAAMAGNCECVKILLERGAVPTVSDVEAADPAAPASINVQPSPISRGTAGELRRLNNLRGGSCFSEGRARRTLIANLIGLLQ